MTRLRSRYSQHGDNCWDGHPDVDGRMRNLCHWGGWSGWTRCCCETTRYEYPGKEDRCWYKQAGPGGRFSFTTGIKRRSRKCYNDAGEEVPAVEACGWEVDKDHLVIEKQACGCNRN